jgi:hypothetical protein
LIVDGVVVSQTTKSSIVKLPPSPGNNIGCTEDFATFDLEGPANCCVDASTTSDCGTAPAGTATAPVDFVPATKVDCVSAPVTGLSGEAEQQAVEYTHTPLGGGGAHTKQKDTRIWIAGARRTYNRRVELHGELGAGAAQLPSGAPHRKFINSLIATNQRQIDADQKILSFS